MKTIKNKLTAISLLIASSVFTTSAMANTNSPLIDQKQQNQKGKIVQGVKSGELTGKETWRLGKQQAKIHHKEARFKSDGQFTRRERLAIHRDLGIASRNIYQQKHDGQVQGGHKHGLRSPGIHHRQINQKRRIGQGIRSGELTRGEALRLGHQQARIQKQKRYLKSDGSFTKRERVWVHQKQNRASKNIYRKKHNKRVR